MTFYFGKFWETVHARYGQPYLHELHSDIELFVHAT